MEFDAMFFLQIEVKVDFYFITLYLYTFDRMGVWGNESQAECIYRQKQARYYRDKLNHFE